MDLRTLGNWFCGKRYSVSDIEEDRELGKKCSEGLERHANVSGDLPESVRMWEALLTDAGPGQQAVHWVIAAIKSVDGPIQCG